MTLVCLGGGGGLKTYFVCGGRHDCQDIRRHASSSSPVSSVLQGYGCHHIGLHHVIHNLVPCPRFAIACFLWCLYGICLKWEPHPARGNMGGGLGECHAWALVNAAQRCLPQPKCPRRQKSGRCMGSLGVSFLPECKIYVAVLFTHGHGKMCLVCMVLWGCTHKLQVPGMVLDSATHTRCVVEGTPSQIFFISRLFHGFSPSRTCGSGRSRPEKSLPVMPVRR